MVYEKVLVEQQCECEIDTHPRLLFPEIIYIDLRQKS